MDKFLEVFSCCARQFSLLCRSLPGQVSFLQDGCQLHED